MDTLPIEVRQAILEGLPTLRDLQSAILSGRPLLAAYVASGRLIRHRVFLNQYYDLEAADASAPWNAESHFVVVDRWIRYLSKKDAYDGLALRETIWPDLLAVHGTCRLGLHDGLYCSWAEDLASSCRQFDDEEKARRVEAQALRLVHPNTLSLGQPWLTWLQATFAACAGQGDYGYAARICKEMWSRISDSPDHRHRPGLDGLALVKVTSKLCRRRGVQAPSESSSVEEVNSALGLAWRFLRVNSASDPYQPGMFCYRCLDAAKLLVEEAQLSRDTVESGLPHLEAVWRSIQPRGMAFNAWSHLMVNSHAGRLEGALKVWAKLQEDRREVFLQDIDLDWARDIIWLLRKKGAVEQSLSFQAEAFDLMSPNDRQYCAFGRNLADAYLKNNQIERAIGVREKVLDELPVTSAIRPSWNMALASLYKKIGREEGAGRLPQSLSKKVDQMERFIHVS